MVLAAMPNQSGLPQMSALVPAGADVGAGLTKIVLDSGAKQIRLRLPSKLHQNKEELHDVLQSPEGGHFFYHSGDRKDLIGQEFLTGQLAAWKAPTTHLKLSDDPALKVEYALHTILGTLATLSFRAEWNLYFVLSTHNAKSFRQGLMDKVGGTHFISFGGKNNPQCKVNLSISLVVPEGAGSYAHCAAAKPEPLIDRTGQAIAIDFGTSTVIPTVFAPGGAIVHRQVLEVGGVVDLLEAIAADPKLIDFLGQGKAGSIETIRQGIENGSFQYGSRPFNFRDLYALHLKPWLADRLRLAFKEVQEWRDVAQSCVAWGGGGGFLGRSNGSGGGGGGFIGTFSPGGGVGGRGGPGGGPGGQNGGIGFLSNIGTNPVSRDRVHSGDGAITITLETPATPVPEPLSCAGTVVAGGIGLLLKRKRTQSQKTKA